MEKDDSTLQGEQREDCYEPVFMATLRHWIVAEAYVELALMRYESGDIAGARISLKNALRLNPGSSLALDIQDRIERDEDLI